MKRPRGAPRLEAPALCPYMGYLARKNPPPPRTLHKAYAWGPLVVLRWGPFLMSEVFLTADGRLRGGIGACSLETTNASTLLLGRETFVREDGGKSLQEQPTRPL